MLQTSRLQLLCIVGKLPNLVDMNPLTLNPSRLSIDVGEMLQTGAGTRKGGGADHY